MPRRGTTKARGYGHEHRRLRDQWKPKVEAGLVNCWRCNQQIKPGQRWDLGHHDGTGNPQGSSPEHALKKDCPAGGNRATQQRGRTTNHAPPAALQWFNPNKPDPDDTIGTIGA